MRAFGITTFATAIGPAVMPACCAAFFLSGCTMHVEEASFIRPDRPGVGGQAAQSAPAPLPAVDLLPGVVLRERAVDTGEGAVLRGLELARAGAPATILYFGGNRFHVADGAPVLLPILGACGANVMMFDYRGYGRSTGAPDVATMEADALRLYDLARARGPVIVHGQSLGSFVAAYVARNRPAAGLVLEATATNPRELTAAVMPWYLAPFLRIELSAPLRAIDNVVAVAGYRGSALVMLGGRDRVTPTALGRKVYAALPEGRKRLLVLPGADHNGVITDPGAGAAYCDFIAAAVRPL